MTPEHQSKNIASWEEVAAGIEEYPDNEAWLPWKPLVRRFLRAGTEAGLNRYFRIGQSMHDIVFSTLDHHGLLHGEPRVTITFHPPSELCIVYGKNHPELPVTKLERVLRFEDGVAKLHHFLYQLWTGTVPGPVPEEIRRLGVSVPWDIAERLRALDYDPEHYAEMVRRHGTSFTRGTVDNLEESERYYHEWAPKLRAFAAECRKGNPCPDPDRLEARDRAKLPIYESLINNAERLSQRRRNEVLICSIPLVGMPVAMSLWPGEDNRSVFLTPEELSAWGEIYEHPEKVFRWFTNYWWRVEDPPQPKSVWPPDREFKTAPGTEPWLVISGLSWSPLAGGEDSDLWSWNGKEAEFVEIVGRLTF